MAVRVLERGVFRPTIAGYQIAVRAQGERGAGAPIAQRVVGIEALRLMDGALVLGMMQGPMLMITKPPPEAAGLRSHHRTKLQNTMLE